jgi:hypothetical protein
MNADMRAYVINILENYTDTQRKIALLRYEMEHPAEISPDEMLETMSFAHGDGVGRSSGHISDKTLYIALNYQERAAAFNRDEADNIAKRLIPLEREQSRLEHYVGLLEPRYSTILRLYYFEHFSWDDISVSMTLSIKTLRKIKSEAVDALTAMYEFSKGTV